MIAFILKYRKFILGGLLVLGLMIYHSLAISTAYNNGKIDTNKVWEVRIAKENEKNRKIENQLDEVISKLNQEIEKENSIRTEKEIHYKDRIEVIIKDNPVYQECVADPSILEYKNEIRKLGPNQ